MSSPPSLPIARTQSPAGGRVPRNFSTRSLKDLRSKTAIRGQSKYSISSDDADLELGKTQSLDPRNAFFPEPPPDFPLRRGSAWEREEDDWANRKPIDPPSALLTTQMRSQRLIGNSNPRYRWAQYWKSEEELKEMKKPLRKYYERNNYLIQQYMYIDKLLDSSIPRDLIEEYEHNHVNVPPTINEEPGSSPTTPTEGYLGNGKPKRSERDLYRVPKDDKRKDFGADEETPLLSRKSVDEEADDEGTPDVPEYEPEVETGLEDSEVKFAVYLNFAANATLLVFKIIVTILTSSLSVLASLVDAALDFLSTFIVWVTGYLISRGDSDKQKYPVGRRRLEPLGVLVFSVIMITSFFQVAIEAFSRLTSSDRSIVRLTPAAIGIMAGTVVIKFMCWLWCRLIRNSGVQALAQDAMTDVVFNTFSIIFPLIGYYARQWWLDPLGGLLLSIYVIVSWSMTTRIHILNLTGRAASKDERNILLYLTMRFAHTIQHIQDLNAYHAGDKLNVEVDIVLDETMSLRDSHDLGESLQYVLESVPGVERAWVHTDYKSVNFPSHLRQ